MRAMASARSRGQPVHVTSRLTRSSCRSLVTLGDRLAAHGVEGWAITWPRVEPGDEEQAPRVVTRLGIAVPHALRAVQRAQSRGLAAMLVGVPLCVLGPFAAWRLTPEAEAWSEGRYPAACEACPARSACPGVEPWYLERFGGEEVRPVERLPARADVERTEALARALGRGVPSSP